jgi:hypothetical protein
MDSGPREADISAHFGTIRQLFATPCADENVHFPLFLVAAEPAQADKEPKLRGATKRIMTMLGIRAKAGFGGMISVSAVLFAIQIITGIQAFPL